MEKNCLLTISILFIGCISTPSKDHDLINRDIFKSILMDCEKYQISHIHSVPSNSALGDNLVLDTVLSSYNCSKEQYYKTLSFYMDSPDTMLVILNEVKDSLVP